MAKNSITDYDNTAANNTDVQSVDIAEGCSPSGINNAIREVMADLADVNDGTVALTSPVASAMSVTTTLTAGGIDINGNDFILDADGDSKIEASTDDTINIISGGTTGFTMNSAGVITQPTKPMFDVRGSAGQSLSDNTSTKVQFNNEQFDIGGYYDPTTNYRYTPLVAGKYFIYGRIYITYGSSIVYQRQVAIHKNGAIVASNYSIGGSSVADYGNLEVSAIIDFNGTTDYVEIFAYQRASSDALIYTNSSNGAFSGYLIG
jgi:hypothetical protein